MKPVNFSRMVVIAGVLMAAATVSARADVVTDWNNVALTAITADRQAPPFTTRSMAMVHSAIFDAVNSVQRRYTPFIVDATPEPGASMDAAASAAARGVLLQLCPSQSAAIEQAYGTSLAEITDATARTKGIALGEKVAGRVLAARMSDGTTGPDLYRPRTAAGVYVPTTGPVFFAWASAKPWVMKSPSQFRPAPPPDLQSAVWTRDIAEILRVGGRTAPGRTPEQTDVARFWILTGAPAWNPLVRQLSASRKLDVVDNARLFALVNVAAADSLVAVFDAKYAFEFWRPVTAVRNADMAGLGVPASHAGWNSLIESPLHPEYPCAHCINAGAVGTVLTQLFGDQMNPALTMTSPTAPGITRQWTSLKAYMQEVSDARVWGGIHYRNSAEVGNAMGRQIAELVLTETLKPMK
jgi:PAP2 superfamily